MPSPETIKRRRAKERAKDAAANRAHAEAVASVFDRGGSCDNCENLILNPAMMRGKFCDLASDYDGYGCTPKINACPRWRQAAK